MKETILRFLFVISLMGVLFSFQFNALHAQEACSDTIFPLKTKNIITECCIEEVKDENFVLYTKNGQHYAVEAIAIIKDGLYVPLSVPENQPVQIQPPLVIPNVQPTKQYKYDYEKYASRYKNAKIVTTVGGFVSITGIAMAIGAVVSNNNGNMSYNRAQTLVVIGFFAFNFGVPTTIIGLAMSKNSKEAMIRAKQRSLNLSLGATNNGVGIILSL